MPKLKEWKDENEIAILQEISNLRLAMLKLAEVKCQQIADGKVRDEAASIEALINLYNSIRDD